MNPDASTTADADAPDSSGTTETRIVMGPDLTRYRTTGTYPDTGRNGLCEKTDSFVEVWAFSRPRRVGDRVQALEPLPRVPDWPLPGPAPQYLTDDPETELRPGDLVCSLFDVGDGRHQIFVHPYQPNGADAAADPFLWGMGDSSYLIARADPREDIDYDPTDS